MSTATVLLLASAMSLLWGSVSAQAQGGLRVSGETSTEQSPWPRWQARLGLATQGSTFDAGARWQLSAGQLLGDYYWSGLRPTGVGRSSGFRATSGLLLGRRSLALGTPALGSAQTVGTALSRSLRAPGGLADESNEPWSAVPYVGVGYSGISLRSGWGFTADLGLAATTGGLRSRREASFSVQGAEELLRDLRLTPVLQFGATYTF